MMKSLKLLHSFLFLVLAMSSTSWAEEAFLVANINREPALGSPEPEDFIKVGDRVFFVAGTITEGRHLWVTDGTEPGTHLVARLGRNSIPLGIHLDPQAVSSAGELYFKTIVGDGFGLWRTDGTAGAIVHLGTFSRDARIRFLGEIGKQGKMVFEAAQAGLGSEPWITDGTRAGTRLLRDIVPGTVGSLWFSEGRGLRDRVVFSAFDEIRGGELWSTDGTAENTEVVLDINPGSASSDPSRFVEAENAILFEADGGDGVGLWWSDGTAAGTRLLLPPSKPGTTKLFRGVSFPGNRIAFIAEVEGARALWITDGTVPGTRRLTSFMSPEAIPAIDDGSSSRFSPLERFEATLVFMADDGLHGLEPWTSDGTAAGTRLLADLCPGPCSSNARAVAQLPGGFLLRSTPWPDLPASSVTAGFWSSDGTRSGTRAIVFEGCPAQCLREMSVRGSTGSLVFMLRRMGSTALEIWRTDGLNEGTFRAAVVRSSETFVEARVAGTYFVFAASGNGSGTELWTTDGTASGTRRLSSVHGPLERGSDPEELTEFGGRLFFVADDEASSRGELWRSDGSQAGTVPITDVVPSQDGLPLHRKIYGLRQVGSFLYFKDPFGTVWRTDGEPSGTVELVTVHGIAEPPREGQQFASLGNRAVFFTRDGLWITDGTPEGTELLSDRVFYSGFDGAVERNQLLYFLGNRLDEEGIHGMNGLWRTDGTPEGTFPTWEERDAPGGPSTPTRLIATGDTLYFIGVRGTPLRGSLWASDGTREGTRRVTPVDLDVFGQPVSIGNRVVFTVDVTRPGLALEELWVYDAGSGSIARVAENWVHTLHALEVVRDRAFYLGFDEAAGIELWSTDGTPVGTARVSDVWPGPLSSHPSNFRAGEGRLYFTAVTPSHGMELWETDGSKGGTVRLTDIAPGPASAEPGPPVRVADHLFLAATEGDLGRELWGLGLEPGETPPGGDVPLPPAGPWLASAQVDGFRTKVRIAQRGGASILGHAEATCIPETLCVSGALPGRSEVFLRVVGPKPNGKLWPMIVKFSTSTVEVWIEQLATGSLRYYRLEGASPGSSELRGLFDRDGFSPP